MANFTWTPDAVEPAMPQFPVVVTQSDSFKKNYQLIDTTAVEQFKLLFKNASTTDRNSILSHFNGEYGGYTSFSWTTVPSYIKSGASQTVRYISYSESPVSESGLWAIEIVFEINV